MNNVYILTYGLFAGAGTGILAAWISLSALTGGAIPGGLGAPLSVTAPLTMACAVLVLQCLTLLMKKER